MASSILTPHKSCNLNTTNARSSNRNLLFSRCNSSISSTSLRFSCCSAVTMQKDLRGSPRPWSWGKSWSMFHHSGSKVVGGGSRQVSMDRARGRASPVQRIPTHAFASARALPAAAKLKESVWLRSSGSSNSSGSGSGSSVSSASCELVRVALVVLVAVTAIIIAITCVCV